MKKTISLITLAATTFIFSCNDREQDLINKRYLSATVIVADGQVTIFKDGVIVDSYDVLQRIQYPLDTVQLASLIHK